MLTPEALALLATRHGVASTAELERCGVPRSSVGHLAATGVLTRCFAGVFRITSSPETLRGRCRAVCLAWPLAVIAGPTAGRLWGLRRMPPDDGHVHVVVQHPARTPRGPGIAGRRSRRLPPADVATLADGIRLTTPARTAFDLAAHLAPTDLASVHEQLLSERTLTMAGLGRTGERLVHPNRPGSLRFQETVSRRRGDGTAESHLEVLLGEALRTAGVPAVNRQRWVALPDGRSIRLDLAVDAIRWGVEADHSAWHAGRWEVRRDKARDRAARLAGWQLDHVTEDDWYDDAVATTDQLIALYLRRTAEVLGVAAAAAEARRLGRAWNP